MTPDITKLTKEATKNVTDILAHAIELKPTEKALVIYDTENGLTNILTDAYRAALPTASFIDFNTKTKDEIIETCNAMSERDLVVLIQSSNFRLDEFRIRLHLFQKKLKVIEHMHLYRNTPDMWGTYVDSLAYDPVWYRGVGLALKAKLETTNELRVLSGETELVITGGVEEPKLNIGDYTGMENIGGTFPIGEVFTEGRDFSQMNGSIFVYAFADKDFLIHMHEPFRVDIEKGLIVGWGKDAPQDFVDIVNLVKSYERPLIREIGFGLNRAITRDHYLGDITAFERILGMHFSLGEKHSVYKKDGITTNKTKFHVDLFPVVTKVLADNTLIFEHVHISKCLLSPLLY
jgi:hypothetical protein